MLPVNKESHLRGSARLAGKFKKNLIQKTLRPLGEMNDPWSVLCVDSIFTSCAVRRAGMKVSKLKSRILIMKQVAMSNEQLTINN